MGKSKDELSPEEYEAIKARMSELRAMAVKKRQEKAAERKVIEAELTLEKQKELEVKKQLVEKKKKENENLIKEVERSAFSDRRVLASKTGELSSEQVSIPEPPPTPPPKPTKKAPIVYDSSSDDEYYKKIKTKIKNKIKKYQGKYLQPQQPLAPPPQPKPAKDIIVESARDELNSKVRSEIKEMAFKALFPSEW